MSNAISYSKLSKFLVISRGRLNGDAVLTDGNRFYRVEREGASSFDGNWTRTRCTLSEVNPFTLPHDQYFIRAEVKSETT